MTAARALLTRRVLAGDEAGRLADNGGWRHPGELVRGVLGLPAGKARLRRWIGQAPG